MYPIISFFGIFGPPFSAVAEGVFQLVFTFENRVPHFQSVTEVSRKEIKKYASRQWKGAYWTMEMERRATERPKSASVLPDEGIG